MADVLPIVTRVPFEKMHCVYLGNVKKVLSAQIDGCFGFRRLSKRKMDVFDARMRELQLYCPSDFNRKPQELSDFNKFKATEFRQFILYTVPAVAKDVFDEEYYQHFMILHAIMRLLVSEETPQDMLQFCREGLKHYVSLCELLYGEQFLSYNVHCLLHLVDDRELLGPSETYSAFCYENNLRELRKYIRKAALKLPQIYKRISEKEDYALTPLDHNVRIRLSLRHDDGPLPENTDANRCQQFNKIEIGKCVLSTSLRNCCCFLKNSKICIIKNIIKEENQIRLIVQQFRSTDEFYEAGISSVSVNIFHCTNLQADLITIQLTDIRSKMYIMPKWSNVVGEEERVIENEWICASLLSPFYLPDNINVL